MMKTFLGSILVFLCLTSLAQHRCAWEAKKRYPVQASAKRQKELRVFSEKTITEDKLLKIPVVVHVIHNNTSGKIGGINNGNISDEQVFSQIKVLNDDYRRKINSRGFNTNTVGVDMRIEFVLANIDPKGKPTTGINRIFESQKDFDVFEDNFKLSKLSYWDSEKYLNIWVTTLADDYLGFAEFPTDDFDGLEIDPIEKEIDGIMIDHRVFGNRTGTTSIEPYTYGRTLTHEVGHWLGLIHIWGDEFCGNDYCGDTPTQERGNLGFSCNPNFSNCSGQRTQNMQENFMDYTPDSCMNLFTIEQSKRVRAILELNTRRKNLINNALVELPKVNSLEIRGENPIISEKVNLLLLVNKKADLYLEVSNTSGQKLDYFEFLDTESKVFSLDISKYPKGVIIVSLYNAEEYIFKRFLIP